ncbi:MAG: FadR family transcriptional regulator [Lachnospiraceae bacterium]|nr:FadR family transcriptional regulator [Lachnospiraceae bacterium]
MEFEKLSAPSLHELFVQQLEHMILSGKLKTGEKLPTERQLAQSMQVSRAVVNGGLAELERKGFVQIKPRVGAFVADYRRTGTLETLISIMNYNGGHLRDEEIRSILEVRIALDCFAVQLCIDHMEDEDLDLLLEKVELIRQAATDTDAALAAFEFQHELAFLSKNTLIPLIFHSFRVPVLALWERFCSLYGKEALYKNNYTLWSYLQRRDQKGALKWIEDSIGESIHGSREIYYH